ncbi:flavodoxin domain-containing protein [Candidatus Blastococcus massiliensis]|uniref:flavodoxin domain-containing protein n=1 Tax=Candidatus Blastococcus massiliensis TaxID=1470358 RepID=UPI00058CCABE|nr:flavodoxin domain-containing protein [Candidatus Blastococcus massiliensis]
MGTSPEVLVAYATAAGSTAGIAERIAAVLTGAGSRTVCAPAGPELDPAPFDALVIGSAVHEMAWLPDALELLRRAAGTGRPVWCFSVGGLAHPDGRRTRWMARGELDRIERGFPPGLTPRDHSLFAGVVDVRRSPLWGRVFYRLTGSSSGDHRDWPAIEAWAGKVAASLQAGTPDPDLPA